MHALHRRHGGVKKGALEDADNDDADDGNLFYIIPEKV